MHHWHYNKDMQGPPTREKAAVLRAQSLFRNQAFWEIARSIAETHPRAIEYLEQAPVLALAALRGKRMAYKQQVFGGYQFGQMVGRGMRLRDIMRAYDVPFQFRALSGHSLSLAAWPPLWRLRRSHPSTLAQIIPPSGKGQATWVRYLVEWSRHMETRYRNGGLHLEWAAKNLKGNSRDATIITVADYIGACGEKFDPRVGLTEVMRAADRWHAELARKVDEEKFVKLHGVSFQHEIDYTPFPLRSVVEGYEFVALNTPESLYVEGVAMHHCVRNYTTSVLKGMSRIFSIRDQEERRVATVEFLIEPTEWRRGPGVARENVEPPLRKCVLNQIQGPCTRDVPKAVKTAAMKFANDAKGVFAMTRETMMAMARRPGRFA